MKAATIGPVEHGYVAPQPKIQLADESACARSPRFNTIEGLVASMVQNRGSIESIGLQLALN